MVLAVLQTYTANREEKLAIRFGWPVGPKLYDYFFLP
jgi:hypothetical protein